ncbi:MAG: hypothetical protein AABZ30_02160, partial [Myxococcota bacterium]
MRHMTIALTVTVLAGGMARAAPRLITYQGRLEGVSALGDVDVTFALYDMEVGGTELWSEEQTVDLWDGVFTAKLGSDEPLDLDFATDTWLQVVVEDGSDEVIFPRQQLTSVAAAFRAFDAEALGGEPPSFYAPAGALIDGDVATTPVGWDDIVGAPVYTATGGIDLTGGEFRLSSTGCGDGDVWRYEGGDWACSASAEPYTGLSPITVTGTSIGLSTTGCGDGELWKYDPAGGGSWSCSADQDTTYEAGSGLTLLGTTFSVNTTAIQTRVTDACASGEAIRVVNGDGTVVCQDAESYTAGTGLTLTGTEFAVNTTVIQGRVTGSCAAGSSIRTVNANGTVTCETDDDTNTTYDAGTYLTLVGTTFDVDTTLVQRRVSASCAVGSAIRVVSATGAVTCETDDDTTYGAGTYLSLTGTTFDVDTALIQRRVSATCAAGNSIRVVAADGTVTCEPDDNTTYGAGTYLSLTGTTFDVDTALIQRRVSATCAAGNSIRVVAADGTVTCEPDDDTTYGAGTYLSLTGTTFDVDTALIQRRVSATCAAGNSIRVVAADGTVTCEPDDNTTYGAGTYLSLTGTT